MMLTWITLAPLGALSIPNPLATAAAAAAADDTVTLWDMSLEEDAEAEAVLGGGKVGGGDAERATPSQLLFIHAGQEDMKEARFHAQLRAAEQHQGALRKVSLYVLLY